jgi:hypothetical protein
MSLFDTAEDLDIQRIALAAKESAELFNALCYGEQPESWPEAWERHPCRQMWLGYEPALAAYSSAMCVRMCQLGVLPDPSTFTLLQTLREMQHDGEDVSFVAPPWMTDTDVLLSHRSNLVRRWPAVFGKTWKGVPPRMAYVWPFVDDSGGYKLMLSKHDKELLAAGERTMPTKILERVENR